MAKNVFWQDCHERISSLNLLSCGRHKVVLDVVVPHVLIRANQTQELILLLRTRKGKEEPRKRWHQGRHLLHLASTVQSRVAGSYEGRLISTVQNSWPKLA